jgi:geranylgeranyl diphosphate synthase type II
MDDDDERRNKPSAHKVFGEAMALLITYSLIAEGYRCIAANAETVRKANLYHSADSDRICTLALENAGLNTGLAGATGGQFLDIFPPTPLSLEAAKEIIHKKTSTLFEVSFVFGWLYGGGDIHALDDVKTMAAHYGLAFQIADDLDDIEQDAAHGRDINIATLVGHEKAYVMFHEEMARFTEYAEKLGINNASIRCLAELLKERAASFLTAAIN